MATELWFGTIVPRGMADFDPNGEPRGAMRHPTIIAREAAAYQARPAVPVVEPANEVGGMFGPLARIDVPALPTIAPVDPVDLPEGILLPPEEDIFVDEEAQDDPEEEAIFGDPEPEADLPIICDYMTASFQCCGVSWLTPLFTNPLLIADGQVDEGSAYPEVIDEYIILVRASPERLFRAALMIARLLSLGTSLIFNGVNLTGSDIMRWLSQGRDADAGLTAVLNSLSFPPVGSRGHVPTLYSYLSWQIAGLTEYMIPPGPFQFTTWNQNAFGTIPHAGANRLFNAIAPLTVPYTAQLGLGFILMKWPDTWLICGVGSQTTPLKKGLERRSAQIILYNPFCNGTTNTVLLAKNRAVAAFDSLAWRTLVLALQQYFGNGYVPVFRTIRVRSTWDGAVENKPLSPNLAGFEWDADLQCPKIGSVRTYSYVHRYMAVPVITSHDEANMPFLRWLETYAGTKEERKGGLTLPRSLGMYANVQDEMSIGAMMSDVLTGDGWRSASSGRRIVGGSSSTDKTTRTAPPKDTPPAGGEGGGGPPRGGGGGGDDPPRRPPAPRRNDDEVESDDEEDDDDDDESASEEESVDEEEEAASSDGDDADETESGQADGVATAAEESANSKKRKRGTDKLVPPKRTTIGGADGTALATASDSAKGKSGTNGNGKRTKNNSKGKKSKSADNTTSSTGSIDGRQLTEALKALGQFSQSPSSSIVPPKPSGSKKKGSSLKNSSAKKTETSAPTEAEIEAELEELQRAYHNMNPTEQIGAMRTYTKRVQELSVLQASTPKKGNKKKHSSSKDDGAQASTSRSSSGGKPRTRSRSGKKNKATEN
nr:MAG: hypothetical protein [Totiviridae sp.]